MLVEVVPRRLMGPHYIDRWDTGTISLATDMLGVRVRWHATGLEILVGYPVSSPVVVVLQENSRAQLLHV